MRTVLGAALLLALAAGLFLVLRGGSDPAGDGASGAGGPDAGSAAAELRADPGADPGPAGLEAGAVGRSELAADRGQAAAPAPPAPEPASLALRLTAGPEQPLAGAEAELFYEEDNPFGIPGLRIAAPGELRVEPEPALTSAADARGRMQFRGVEPGRPLRLVASAARRAQEVFHIAPLLPGESRDLGPLVLGPGVRLGGVVRDPDGGPVAAASVSLARSAAGAGLGVIDGGRSTTTGAAGRFVLEGIAPGAYSVTAERQGYESAGERIELDALPAERELDLQLRAGWQVSGTVTGPAGKVLEGACVALVPAEGFATLSWSRARVLADGIEVGSDGGFRLGGLPGTGSFRVAAAAPGHAITRSDPVRPGESVDLVLQPLSKLRGRVIDSAGAPVPLADLQLRDAALPPGSWALAPARMASTDADGAFEFEEVRAGGYRLQVDSAAGAAERTGIRVAPGAEPEPLLVQVAGELGLVVRLRNEAGAPVAGARVTVRSIDDGGMPGPGGRRVRVRLGGPEPGRVTRTDAQGEAHFHGLPAGAWTVETHPAGYGRVKEMLQRERVERQELDLQLARESGLRVTVVDAAGQPVAQTGVELSSDDPGIETATRTTDRWGQVVFTDLKPGSYAYRQVKSMQGMVFVRGNGNDQDAEAEAPATPVSIPAGEVVEARLVLAAKAVARVRVTRFGQPVSDALVRLREEGKADFSLFGHDPDSLQATTGSDGWADLPPADPGAYVLSAQSNPQNPVTEKTVQLLSGVQELEVALASGILRGTVLGPGGPVAGARVHIAPDAGEDGGGTRRQTGMFVVSGSIDGAGGEPAMETQDFLSGQTTTNTDSEGRFRFEDVPEGEWVLRIDATGYSRHESEGIAHDGRSDVDVGVQTLRQAGRLRGVITGLPAPEPGDDPGAMQVTIRLVELLDEEGNQKGVAPVYPNGRYEFRDIEPGTYKLSVRADPLSQEPAPESGLIEVLQGEVTEFDYELPAR